MGNQQREVSSEFRKYFVGDLKQYQLPVEQEEKPKSKLPKIRKFVKKSKEADLLELEAKYQEHQKILEEKYGLKPKVRYGDSIVKVNIQDTLESLVNKHYKRTKLRDCKESVKELSEIFSNKKQRHVSFSPLLNNSSSSNLLSQSHLYIPSYETIDAGNQAFHTKLL